MARSNAGMYDLSTKAKLLRSLVKEYVPDEKHPFSNPSELSYVVSTIKTHKLLSEWAPQPLQKDLADGWKAAVDSWVNRVLTLASSDSPDKSWAGICLLGVTCQECSLERFSASYAVWLNKLLSHIQALEGFHLVKSACCASLSDMFTRLSGLSNAKKDATSHATKTIQPLLKLLTGDISSVVLEEALSLLCTMIKLFPFSVHRHYDSVEAVIVSKLMSGKCSASALKKLGYSLALLPQSRGDEDSWSVLMLKILLCINNQLNDAFQGLEEESRGIETMRALLPSSKESPPPLGGSTLSELSSELSLRRPERVLECRISTLLNCCSNMLTSSYPVMVSLPIYGIVAFARRILMVNDSLFQSSYSFMSTLKQEFIYSELPLLQLHSLDILMAIVTGLSSQLLPYIAEIVQLLIEYLTRCTFPHLRVKVYSIIKVLLMSIGIGITIHLNQEIINSIFMDLNFVGGWKGEKTLDAYRSVRVDLLSESRQRKRKHQNITGSVQEQPARDALLVEALHYSLTPISVKIAALEALEALLTVGGSVISESWRANVDHLLITVATDACKVGLSNEEMNILSGEPISNWTDFRLAALRALLASLLSPGRVRPPHIGLSLELFRRGVQETGTEISKLCGHALLSLEVLIHPRALPLLDLDSSFNYYTSQPRTLGHEAPGEPKSDDDDDLNENWLQKDDEFENNLTEEPQNAIYTKNTSVIEKGPFTVPSVEARHDSKASELSMCANLVADKGKGYGDDLMVGSLQFENTRDQALGSALPNTGASYNDKSEPLSTKIALTKNGVAFEGGELKVPTSEHMLQNKEDGFTAIVEQISATLLNTDKNKVLTFESDNELALDSIPDIVDGDPDSD